MFSVFYSFSLIIQTDQLKFVQALHFDIVSFNARTFVKRPSLFRLHALTAWIVETRAVRSHSLWLSEVCALGSFCSIS